MSRDQFLPQRAIRARERKPRKETEPLALDSNTSFITNGHLEIGKLLLERGTDVCGEWQWSFLALKQHS